MQENNIDQPPSLSQLLRESYLAEARAQQRHSEMSRSDASSSRLQIYRSLKGKAEDSVGHSDPQFPDLSAFLSQEELDKSVNLARQAIGHEPREERAEVKAHVKPSTPSNISSVSSSEPPSPLNSKNCQNAPYGPETQSKKEFLNKAADFIEELSALFKANSSKRVRPRGCKSHRTRNQNKSQNDGTVHPLGPDNRERSAVPAEEAESCALTDTPYPAEPACEPPCFIQKLKSREVPEGSKVQLDCIVRGLPVPEVRWFCEGKELENSPDIQIITNGELHSLIIAEAFEEDTGRYSCFASNFYGTDSTSAEIYVEGDSCVSLLLTLLQFRETLLVIECVPFFLSNQQSQTSNHNYPNYPQSLNGQPIMAAPVFTKSLQDLLASEGQLVVLECRVKGVPSPRVDWSREGKIIEDSPDFRILQKSNPRSSKEICTLVIAEVFPEDSGVFTCTASNKYGTVSSAATLRVKGNTCVSLSSLEPNRIQEPSSAPTVNPQPGVTTNHKVPRTGSRVGLRVHFKLPEDEEDVQSDASSQFDEDTSMSVNKEPPPVLAKPKL
uniref:Ig-like domain-containing protein n=1 Tax=Sander lucioperca TaxID=283035 RepID=A0A8D0ALM0_SANLU